MVGGSYYFQNLAEFSKEIPFKIPPPQKKSRASREKMVGGFYYFQKVLENFEVGFI